MGVVQRKSIFGVMVSYLGIGLGTIIVVLILPYYFSVEEFGLRSFIFDVATISSMIFMAGLGGSLIKYYPEIRHSGRLKGEAILKALITPSLVFLLPMIYQIISNNKLGLLFKSHSPLGYEYFNYGLIIGYILSIFQLLEVYGRNLMSFNTAKTLNNIVIRLIAITLIIAYGLNCITLNEFWIYTSIGYGTIVLIMLWHILRKEDFKFQFKDAIRVPKRFQEISTYSTFSLLSGSSSMLLSRIDAVMIAILLGLTENGIYAMAIFISVLIDTPRRILSQVTSPMISKSLNENDTDQLNLIYKKTSQNLTLLGTLIFLLIWVNKDLLFGIMPKGDTYVLCSTALFFLGLSRIFDMFYGCNNEIIAYSSKYYKLNFYALMLLLALAMSSNYFLIPIYGIEGAAVATLISIVIYNLYKAYIIKTKMNLKFLKLSTLYNFIILALILVIDLYFDHLQLSTPIEFLLINIIISILYGIGILKLNMAEDAKNLLTNTLPFLKKFAS